MDVSGDVANVHKPEVTVITEEEFDASKEASSGMVLLQVGSDACERCPAFGAAVAELKTVYNFKWLYCDAHHVDTDIPEALEITKLPAFAFYNPGPKEQIVVANASPDNVRQVVAKECTPILQLDADF